MQFHSRAKPNKFNRSAAQTVSFCTPDGYSRPRSRCNTRRSRLLGLPSPAESNRGIRSRDCILDKRFAFCEPWF